MELADMSLSEEQRTNLGNFLEEKKKIIGEGEMKEQHFVRISELGFGNGGVVLKVQHKPTGIIMARKVYMHDTCISYAWYMYITCMVHVYHMHGTCISHAWHMYITCMAHVYHMHGTCISHARHMYNMADDHVGYQTCCEESDHERTQSAS